jgi:hypothetical protein
VADSAPRVSMGGRHGCALVIPLLGVLIACAGSGGSTGPANPRLSYLSLFPDRRATIVGDFFTLQVTARDTAGSDVPGLVPTYSSADSGVLGVESGGTVVALGTGTARVRATAGGQTAETIVYVGDSAYDLATLAPR